MLHVDYCIGEATIYIGEQILAAFSYENRFHEFRVLVWPLINSAVLIQNLFA